MLRSRRLPAALVSLLVLCAAFAGGVSVAKEPKVGSTPAAIVKYRDSGEWTRTITRQYDRARKYVKAWLKDNPKPRRRKPAVVLDIDDTALSWYFCAKELSPPFGSGLPGCAVSSLLRAIPQARSFYNYVRARGVTVFFITGRPEGLRPQTTESLRDARYKGKLRIYLKPSSYKKDVRDRLQGGCAQDDHQAARLPDSRERRGPAERPEGRLLQEDVQAAQPDVLHALAAVEAQQLLPAAVASGR